MFRWIFRSGLVLFLFLMIQGGNVAAFDLGKYQRQASSYAENISRDAGAVIGTEAKSIIDSASLSQEDSLSDYLRKLNEDKLGSGFYTAIYEDVVKTPNDNVKQEILRRFGFEIDMDTVLPDEQGQYIFTDFFKDPWSSNKNPAQPNLKDSLQSDCVRIRLAQVDDEEHRWDLVRNRLRERSDFQKKAETDLGNVYEVLDIETLQRLMLIVTQVQKDRVQQLLKQLPNYRGFDDQQILFQCYADLSSKVSFESQLQSVLNPVRKKLEVLQTFVNGRLNDFEVTSGFPLYDLIFDVDVMDLLLFGEGDPTISTGIASSEGGHLFDKLFGADGRITEGVDGYGAVRDEVGSVESSGNGGIDGSIDSNLRVSKTENVGFGNQSAISVGDQCTEEQKGLVLNYSQAPRSVTHMPRSSERTSGHADTFTPSVFSAWPEEGFSSSGINQNTFCEGLSGMDFGNDLLKMIFCLSIDFKTLGKTWETVRDNDHSITSHVVAMNKIFEEEVLSNSVRPHKNTGTIMESGICEGGYGNDIGFHVFLEWVPVQFYPDICYPKGGITDSRYAELVGYPELASKLSIGKDINCSEDFLAEDAKERCKKAIGSEQATVLEFNEGYLDGIDDGIQDIDEVDLEKNLWTRLVGAQGVAERELHFFLYRLGKSEAQFGEDTVYPVDSAQPSCLNFAQRLKELDKRMNNILISTKADDSTDNFNKLMALKGRFIELKNDMIKDAGGEEEVVLGCRSGYEFHSENDSFQRFNRDLLAERERIQYIVNQWNSRKSDFNGENRCSSFENDLTLDAGMGALKDYFSEGYYLETDARRTKSLEEQVSGQIFANTDMEDFDQLFGEISDQVERIDKLEVDNREQARIRAEQAQSLQYSQALGLEFLTLKANLKVLSDWWGEMVSKNEFNGRGGRKINVLDAFLEKKPAN